MSVPLCCPECFGDDRLKLDIFPTLETTVGTCHYCASEGVARVVPNELADWFEPLINVYAPDIEGRPIIHCLKEDWLLFEHKNMNDSKCALLLGDVLNCVVAEDARFSPSTYEFTSALATWETLRDEMMYVNRWFLKQSVDLERLRQLLDFLIAKELPSEWYRARLWSDGSGFPINEMGAPPARKTTVGRANPAGIPYLYLGSSPETAVSEVRPHTGDSACVAAFSVPSIKAVDLRVPRKLVSPFILTDSEEIGQLYVDLPFLERLGNELTKPVLPTGAAIDYIPSQYLCEFIKTCGFDGVIYRSSVSAGINLALFNPSVAVGCGVEVYDVAKVSIEVLKAKAAAE